MSEVFDLFVKKPVSIWFRDLAASPAEIISSLGKAAISFATGEEKDTAEHVIDAFKGISFAEDPASTAWVLIFRSLQNSLTALIKEYGDGDFFHGQIPAADIESINIAFENTLSNIDVGLNTDFFDHPDRLPLLDDLKLPLIQWLISLGMKEANAIAFHQRLKSKFVVSLHQEWTSNSSDYLCIEQSLNSPFTQATKQQREWIQYHAWLQEKADERMFAEAFSLKQVYVPLRAYYEEKVEQEDDATERSRHKDNDKQRIAVDLHTEVESWVLNFNKDNAVRIISGGPGSGKSSFAKMFAAHIAQNHPSVPVLFIPLHLFDPTEDLTTAVEQFTRDERYLNTNPLDVTNGQDRLLLIFDGLDELSMQGKAAAETAQHFVDEVIRKIDRFNSNKLQRQALITGRDLSVQSASPHLRTEKQILQVLPYFLSEREIRKYTDDYKLLSVDQRDLWWQNYAKAKELPFDDIPDELRIKRLTPITQEPLLNYLVALSYQRKKIEFSENTTLNTIYEDLLHAVHERQWDDGGRHQGAKHLSIDQFIRVLEEIALAVWHGDGRTATVEQIFQRCKNSKLDRYLNEFQEGAQKGVSRLLTAFYFR